MGITPKYLRIVSQVCLLSGLLFLPDDSISAREGAKEKGYEFKQDLKRVVGMLRVGGAVYGRLDDAGNFLEDPSLAPPVLNRPRKPKEPVYEYRSGFLVAGTLRDDGVFVPDLGAVVIPFKIYQYGRNSPRIYNLPGKFVKKRSSE